MIPRHKPSFGVVDILRAYSNKEIDSDSIEEMFCRICGVKNSVLTPSARSGISWALKTNEKPMIVYTFAFSCEALHESVFKANCILKTVDCIKDNFTIDYKKINIDRSKPLAIIVPLVFGIDCSTYEKKVIRSLNPYIIIYDQAMTTPIPEKPLDLDENECVFYSFGIGKSFYAGSGGIGLTNNDIIAEKIRYFRDSNTQKNSNYIVRKKSIEIFARVLAHKTLFYKTLRNIRERHEQIELKQLKTNEDYVQYFNKKEISIEWCSFPTRLEKWLISLNIKRLKNNYDQRKELEKVYRDAFSKCDEIVLPRETKNSLSHFSILVGKENRDRLKKLLSMNGIDTGTLFRFNHYLSSEDFPNTYCNSLRVINLPLYPSISKKKIVIICRIIITFLKRNKKV